MKNNLTVSRQTALFIKCLKLQNELSNCVFEALCEMYPDSTAEYLFDEYIEKNMPGRAFFEEHLLNSIDEHISRVNVGEV
jgi:hypothetical protein